MGFEKKGETVIAAHDLEELKLVYRVLHANLSQHPKLMDTHFLIELQNFLQARAKEDGVDVGHHGAWDTWLGNARVSCELRIKSRGEIKRPEE